MRRGDYVRLDGSVACVIGRMRDDNRIATGEWYYLLTDKGVIRSAPDHRLDTNVSLLEALAVEANSPMSRYLGSVIVEIWELERQREIAPGLGDRAVDFAKKRFTEEGHLTVSEAVSRCIAAAAR